MDTKRPRDMQTAAVPRAMFFKMLIASLKAAMELIWLLTVTYLFMLICYGGLWWLDDEMKLSVTEDCFQRWFRGFLLF